MTLINMSKEALRAHHWNLEQDGNLRQEMEDFSRHLEDAANSLRDKLRRTEDRADSLQAKLGSSSSIYFICVCGAKFPFSLFLFRQSQ